MKRFARIIGCAAALFAAPAAAQIRPDVTVNPSAGGSRVLLYPDGKHARVLHPLLQPGEADPNAPVALHMPRPHAVVHRAIARKAPSKPKTAVAAAAPAPAAEPPPESGMAFSSLPSDSAARLLGDTTTSPETAPVRKAPVKPAPVKQAPVRQAAAASSPPAQKPAPAPKKSAPVPTAVARVQTPPPSPAPQPAPPQQKIASAEPPPAETKTSDMKDVTGRSSVAFQPGAEEPAPAALDTVRALAGSLNASLWSGSARIQLDAFGGGRGDKSSDARRLSLKRALIVRQLLIDDGIPSERIDVHAMGGADGGQLDRVDIYVRG